MLDLFDPFTSRPRCFIVPNRGIYSIPALLGSNAEGAHAISRL